MKTRQDPTRNYGGVRAGQRMKERKAKLMAAGLEVIGTGGYAGASIKEICKHAGLTERYFYESFKNKEALLLCVYNGIVEDLIIKATACMHAPERQPREAALATIRLYFETLQNDPRKARILYFEVLGVSPDIDRAYRTAQDHLVDMVSQVMGTAFPGVDGELLNKSIVPKGLAGAINFLAHHWVMDAFDPPLDDILSQITFIVDTFESMWPTAAS